MRCPRECSVMPVTPASPLPRYFRTVPLADSSCFASRRTPNLESGKLRRRLANGAFPFERDFADTGSSARPQNGSPYRGNRTELKVEMQKAEPGSDFSERQRAGRPGLRSLWGRCLTTRKRSKRKHEAVCPIQACSWLEWAGTIQPGAPFQPVVGLSGPTPLLRCGNERLDSFSGSLPGAAKRRAAGTHLPLHRPFGVQS